MMDKLLITKGLGYCDVEGVLRGRNVTAYANGHGAGLRDEPCPDDARWGEMLPDVRYGYEEGKRLRARTDMDGDLPSYIVTIYYDGCAVTRTLTREESAPFKVRDLWPKERA